MTEVALKFTPAERIGRIASVDTNRVYIDVQDHALLTRVLVGNLIGVTGRTADEFLIGITQRVTREVREEILLQQEDAAGNVPFGEAKVDTILAVLVGTFRAVQGSRRNVFKRGADTFPQIDRDCYLIEGGNLQRLMNLLAKELPPDKQLKLGHYALDPSATAVVDGDRFFQRHAAVLGSTGAGKSCAIALVLERADALDHPNLIVLDIHGEYRPLAEANHKIATYFRIAGPGDLNDPEENVIFLPYWLLNREEMLAMLLDRSDQNAPNQAARFTNYVRELKEETLKRIGHHEDVLATFTVDSPIPYPLETLLERLQRDNTEMVQGQRGEKQGEWYGKLTRFISRFHSKMEDRRYGFMFKPSPRSMDYSWLADQLAEFMASDENLCGIKIIDFSDVPSDILPIVVGVFARLIYDVQFWLPRDKSTPITIVCDEAHLYLPVREETDSIEARALEVFERIAKEGRKYGISLVAVSQRPSDVSRTILSQCNNFLVLRLTNDQDQSVVRHLMPDSMVGLTAVLPLLDVGEALLLGDAVLLPARIKLDLPRIQPASATRDFWTEWGQTAPDVQAIKEAVETLRRQTRL